MVADPSAPPGGRIPVRWLVDGEILLGPDMSAECWTGDGWVTVWVTREIFREPSVELVDPGQELYSNDEGFTEREGVVLIPSEAPPGTYRVGGREHDVRIEVTGAEG